MSTHVPDHQSLDSSNRFHNPCRELSSWSNVEVLDLPVPLRVQRRRASGYHYDLWCCRTEDLPISVLVFPQSLGLLSASELEGSGRFRFTKDRDLFLMTRILVRSVLSQYADIPPAEWRFTKNHFGRPEINAEIKAKIAPQVGPGDLVFNLSHSGSLAVCAVSTCGSVGVDVEDARQILNLMEVASGVLAKSEFEHLTSVPEQERTVALLQYWVLKEAYAKACGVGLTMEMRSLAFSGMGSGCIRVRFSEGILDTPEHWHFEIFEPFEHFCSAVAYSPRATY